MILKLRILFSSLEFKYVLLNHSPEVADCVARVPILTVVWVSWCEKAHILSTKAFI